MLTRNPARKAAGVLVAFYPAQVICVYDLIPFEIWVRLNGTFLICRN